MSALVLAQEFVGSAGSRLVIAAAAGGAAAALVGTFSVLVGRRQAQLERRLAGYDVSHVTVDQSAGGSGPDTAVVQQGVELASKIADRYGLLGRTEQLLDQAALPIRAGEVLFYVPVLAVFAFLLVSIVAGPFAGLAGGAAAVALPIVWLRRRRAQRLARFEAMLPSTLTLLASSMRAGFSLLQALETLAEETRDPVQREMQRVFTEVRLGRPAEEALADVAERMKSRDLAWTVMAIKIQREVGGNLAALLDTVSDTMTKRQQLRREVKTLTAEGRLSAVVLSIFPPIMALLMYAARPDYIQTLFSHAIGVVAVVFASALTVVGWFWLRRIVDLKE
jgi:tight adherence protein B